MGNLAAITHLTYFLETPTFQTSCTALIVMGCGVLTEATEVHLSEVMTWRMSE